MRPAIVDHAEAVGPRAIDLDYTFTGSMGLAARAPAREMRFSRVSARRTGRVPRHNRPDTSMTPDYNHFSGTFTVRRHETTSTFAHLTGRLKPRASFGTGMTVAAFLLECEVCHDKMGLLSG